MKKIILSILTVLFLYSTFSVGGDFVWNITHEDQDSLIIGKLISINKDMGQIIIKSEKYISGKKIGGEIKIVAKGIYFKKYAKNEFLGENVLVSISEKDNNYYLKRGLYKLDVDNGVYMMSDDFGGDNNKILNHYINTGEYVIQEYKEDNIEKEIIKEEKTIYTPKQRGKILIKRAYEEEEEEEQKDETNEKLELKDNQEVLLNTNNIKKYIINILIYGLLIILLIFVSMVIFFAIKHKKEDKEEKIIEEGEKDIYSNEIEESNTKEKTEKENKEEDNKEEDKNGGDSFYDEYYQIDDDDDDIIEINKNNDKDINKKLDKNPFDI